MVMDNLLFRIVILFFILQTSALYAQTNVDLKEEASVSREMEKYVRNNSLVTHLNGWRIAVATTKFQAQFDYKVKWEYKEPYYYLRAGAFLTRTEASQALDVVKKKFPGAFLSMDKVAYEEL
jgi:hypothetical protein